MKSRKLLFLAVTLLFASPSFSESEVEAWYTSKGNEYLVRDSVHGNLHALLSTAKSGKPFVYIVMFDSDCKDASTDVIAHNPIYVNNMLTRYQQYCDGERRYFMPASEAGREHIVREFTLRNFVELKTHDESFKAIFSAKGFTTYFNKVVLERQGI